MNWTHASNENALLALVQGADDLTALYRAGLLPARDEYALRSSRGPGLRLRQPAIMGDWTAYTDSHRDRYT